MSGDLPAPVADSFTLSLRLFFFASLRPVTFSHTFPPSILHSLSRRGCWMNGSISALHVRVCVTAANVEGLSFFLLCRNFVMEDKRAPLLAPFSISPSAGRNVSFSARVCTRACVYLRRERHSRAEEGENPPKKAKCSETDSQRLLLLGLIPSRVSCKDVEL